MNIKIITDSTADLTKELYEQNEIEVIPLNVTIGGVTYKDGVNITSRELFDKVDMYNELPKSASENTMFFYNLFKKRIEEGYDILYLGIGRMLSGTYSNAMMALDELSVDERKHIRIIDSANLSSGIGILLLKAAKYRRLGLNIDEIKDKIEEIKDNVRVQFAINTLDYLHKGGRCSGTVKVFGSLLKIKPIIKVRSGVMTIGKMPIGKFERALNVMVSKFKNDYEEDGIDDDYVFITHCLANDEYIYLKNSLGNIIDKNIIVETQASSTISVHCGPKTIGIIYIKNKKEA